LAGALRNVRHQFCLLLTGTPLQNNLHEFYALLSFLLPDIFTDSTPFDKAFNLATNEVDNQQLVRAHYLSKLLILRRTKANINMVLPPKLETRVNCPLSEMQLFWYKRLLLRNSAVMLQTLGASSNIPVSSSGAFRDLHKA
jgi:SWI/SNF-related matrix-associated actin-dependent regulator of chromatin subfamily A member 5